MFERTPLEGLLIYSPRVHRDDRGYFFESFQRRHFEEMGLSCDFVQDNLSSSAKGTVRGLHLQKDPFAQAKLVGVVKGAIFDVALDLRPGSATFGSAFSITLSEDEAKYLYVPRGFAHGFMALSDVARVTYKVDNVYSKESEAGVLFDDPDLGVRWPAMDRVLLSEKDRLLPRLKDFLANPKT